MSGIRSISRSATLKGYATPNSTPIYIDSDDNILKMVPAGSGTTEVQIVDASSVQTISGKFITPAKAEYLADGAIASTSHTAILTSTDAGAYTLGTPATDGIKIDIVNATSFAHVITGTNLFWAGVTGGPFNKITTAAFPGFSGSVISHGSLWMVLSSGLGILTVGD
jgi:hypothetical protein